LLGLRSLGWGVMFLSLLLIGIRLSQLSVRPSFSKLLPSLAIKMLLMPLLTGLSLTLCGVDGNPRLVIVLQTAMPAAFSTLVLAEVYQLDQDLAVSVIVIGSLGLLLLLPLELGLKELGLKELGYWMAVAQNWQEAFQEKRFAELGRYSRA
jgi:malate permease and related proteins